MSVLPAPFSTRGRPMGFVEGVIFGSVAEAALIFLWVLILGDPR